MKNPQQKEETKKESSEVQNATVHVDVLIETVSMHFNSKMKRREKREARYLRPNQIEHAGDAKMNI